MRNLVTSSLKQFNSVSRESKAVSRSAKEGSKAIRAKEAHEGTSAQWVENGDRKVVFQDQSRYQKGRHHCGHKFEVFQEIREVKLVTVPDQKANCFGYEYMFLD